MSRSFSVTSESVSEGHPDKVADQISDAVLDAILAADPRGRVACETLVKTGVVIVAGEGTTTAWGDVEALVRKTVLDIGYDTPDMGFDGGSCGVLNIIGKQSPDIAQGVDRKDERKQGAGDQGLMFGYATDETDVLMPAPITVATFGTGKLSDTRLTQLVRAHFDLTPFGLREMLDLARPIYQKTASYGHFGRKEEEFSWERTDKAAALASELKSTRAA